MLTCERPDCFNIADRTMVVTTPFGEPAVCILCGQDLQSIYCNPLVAPVRYASRWAWLIDALRFGPGVHALRWTWLEDVAVAGGLDVWRGLQMCGDGL